MGINRWFWFEHMTTDVAAAKDFYAKVVGYHYKEWPDPSMQYTIIETPSGKGIGGIMTLPPEAAAAGAPPNWMGTVWVADADAIAARIVELGGKVQNGPFDIPNVGRYIVATDPQGAFFAALAPAPMEGGGGGGMPEPTEPGGMCWAELWTSEPEAALAFYRALFGWQETGSMDMGPEGLYRMYGVGETSFGGVARLMPGQPVPAWLYYFVVPSAEAAIEATKAAGGTILMGPHDVPGGGRIAIGCDPLGAAFAVYAQVTPA